MHSEFLPFPIIVFTIFTIIFIGIFVTIVRSALQIFKITNSANSDEARAELLKMVATLKTDGKLNSKTFISVQRTDSNGTSSKLIGTEANPTDLINEIVSLSQESNKSKTGSDKIKTINNTGYEIVQDKDAKKGIFD